MSGIRDEFQVHLLNDEGIAKARELAGKFSTLLNDLEQLAACQPGQRDSPNGREMALVRTHLQDAAFWAKRAIAVHPANQKAE